MVARGRREGNKNFKSENDVIPNIDECEHNIDSYCNNSIFFLFCVHAILLVKTFGSH